MEIAAAPPLTVAAPASWRGELRALTALAATLVAANLMQMAVYAVDVIFVSRLGTAELAAATLSVGLAVVSLLLLWRWHARERLGLTHP